MTAPPVPLVAGTVLELSPQFVLALPAGALGGDDPHLPHHGDHLLGQHSLVAMKGCMLLPRLFAAH